MRVAFGYFKKHFLMTDSEVAKCRHALVACASSHGLDLSALFIDEIETAPQELHKALLALMQLDERVLITPSLLHFAGNGNPIEFRKHLQLSHIEVLLSDTPKPAGRAC
jgi:hypothetical protein